MTCYQRMHEVLLGVSKPSAPLDWDAILWDWMDVTDVHDRDHMLGRMGVDPIDIYDLPTTDLSRFSGLIVSGRVDQEWLYRHRDQLRAFLDDGKVIVYSGQLFRPWLPGAGTAELVNLASLGGLKMVTFAPHPVFGALTPADFGSPFIHGVHPLPVGAEAIISLADGRAVAYIDRVSSGGTILLHTGINFMNFIVQDTAVRDVIPQLVAWINAEAESRAAAGVGA